MVEWKSQHASIYESAGKGGNLSIDSKTRMGIN